MAELISQLGIDWRLLLAQIVNFLVLFWVLKRFAFGPLSEFLRNRQKTVEKGLADAVKASEDREKLKVLRGHMRTKAQKEAEQIIQDARKKGENEYQAHIQKSQTDAEYIVEQAKQEITSEKEKALDEARSDLGALVLRATAKVLGQKVDETKDKEIVQKILREIK